MFKGGSLSELAHKQNDGIELEMSSNQFHQSVLHGALPVIHVYNSLYPRENYLCSN